MGRERVKQGEKNLEMRPMLQIWRTKRQTKVGLVESRLVREKVGNRDALLVKLFSE